ncbi:hypothetical protein DAI22_11g155300 [Oryza sativa Japonica Group]|nr:hypothetical protein DAI22_11g155300 [Oryza sativa Japonica Group]
MGALDPCPRKRPFPSRPLFSAPVSSPLPHKSPSYPRLSPTAPPACSSIRSTGRHRDGEEKLGSLEEEGEPVVGEATREAALGGGAGGVGVEGGVVSEATREAARGGGVRGRRRRQRRLEGERGAGGGRPGADLAGKPPLSLLEARSGKPHSAATPTATTLDGDGNDPRRRRRRPRGGGKGIWQSTSSATPRTRRRRPPRTSSPSATPRACRHRPPHAALAVRHHASFD